MVLTFFRLAAESNLVFTISPCRILATLAFNSSLAFTAIFTQRQAESLTLVNNDCFGVVEVVGSKAASKRNHMFSYVMYYTKSVHSVSL